MMTSNQDRTYLLIKILNLQLAERSKQVRKRKQTTHRAVAQRQTATHLSRLNMSNRFPKCIQKKDILCHPLARNTIWRLKSNTQPQQIDSTSSGRISLLNKAYYQARNSKATMLSSSAQLNSQSNCPVKEETLLTIIDAAVTFKTTRSCRTRHRKKPCCKFSSTDATLKCWTRTRSSIFGKATALWMSSLETGKVFKTKS